MEDRLLNVVYVPIDSICPYENNAKLHPQDQIDQIALSIKEVGFRDPIGVWKGEIVEGHGRYLAAKQLGMTTVPVIFLDDMTDEQRKAYALIHNKLTMNSDFDKDFLALELTDITDIDMSAFGFDLGEEEKEKPEKPEVAFTEVLGEEHNYVVLYFDNAVDWLQMESILDCEGKMNLSTRKDGRVGKNMKRISVGRVFNGADALERMREHFENLH